MSFNITPVASGYQEIHPYSAMNIDSVKINTSLIMMKEWTIWSDTTSSLFFMDFKLLYPTPLSRQMAHLSNGIPFHLIPTAIKSQYG